MKNAIRIYNALLRFYPASYRSAFGAQMLQTFIDHYKDEVSGGHVNIRFWISTITDEFQNIAAQYGNLLMEGNSLRKVTVWKLLIAAVFIVPLYAIFYALLVRVSLALPHPHVSGISVVIALAALLLVFPGALSITASYLLANMLVSLFAKRKPGITSV